LPHRGDLIYCSLTCPAVRGYLYPLDIAAELEWCRRSAPWHQEEYLEASRSLRFDEPDVLQPPVPRNMNRSDIWMPPTCPVPRVPPWAQRRWQNWRPVRTGTATGEAIVAEMSGPHIPRAMAGSGFLFHRSSECWRRRNATAVADCHRQRRGRPSL